jgi:hypothetical protein
LERFASFTLSVITQLPAGISTLPLTRSNNMTPTPP